jgi:hypothetical protein
MKTKDGFEYEFRPGSSRLIDLAERLWPVVDKWARDGNLPPGDRVDVVLFPLSMEEVPHRTSFTMPEEKD